MSQVVGSRSEGETELVVPEELLVQSAQGTIAIIRVSYVCNVGTATEPRVQQLQSQEMRLPWMQKR